MLIDRDSHSSMTIHGSSGTRKAVCRSSAIARRPALRQETVLPQLLPDSLGGCKQQGQVSPLSLGSLMDVLLHSPKTLLSIVENSPAALSANVSRNRQTAMSNHVRRLPRHKYLDHQQKVGDGASCISVLPQPSSHAPCTGLQTAP